MYEVLLINIMDDLNYLRINIFKKLVISQR